MALLSTSGRSSMTTDIIFDLAAAAIAADRLPGAPYGSLSTEAGQMAPNRLESAHMALFEPLEAQGGRLRSPGRARPAWQQPRVYCGSV